MQFPTTCSICRKPVARRQLRIEPKRLRGFCPEHAPEETLPAIWEEVIRALPDYHSEEDVAAITRYIGNPYSVRMTTEQVFYILQRQKEWGTNLNETIKRVLDFVIDRNPLEMHEKVEQPEPETEPEPIEEEPAKTEEEPEEENDNDNDTIELRF